MPSVVHGQDPMPRETFRRTQQMGPIRSTSAAQALPSQADPMPVSRISIGSTAAGYPLCRDFSMGQMGTMAPEPRLGQITDMPARAVIQQVSKTIPTPELPGSDLSRGPRPSLRH